VQLQILAQQGVLLAEAGFRCHLLPQQLEVSLGCNGGAHVPLHGINDSPGLVVRNVDADEGIIPDMLCPPADTVVISD